MFYHRHVVAVTPEFGVEFGQVPAHSALFLCDNTNTKDVLRGDKILPRLLGTESYNFLDKPWQVEFAIENPEVQKTLLEFRNDLLTAGEMKTRLNVKIWKGQPSIRAKAAEFIRAAETRAEIHSLGGQTKVRFAGVTTTYQDPGNFLSHGLMEIQTCVDGVCTWRPYHYRGQLELYRRYAPGDAVIVAPPGAYEPVKIGRIVDFLDENVARIHLKL